MKIGYTKQAIIDFLFSIRNEENNIVKFVNSLGLNSDQKILDIGCGYGKKSKLLRSYGFNVLGIDINPDIVKKNLDAGLPCMTVSDFEQTNDFYDVLLMSHIIEHFQPNKLLCFMERYLNRLKPGGHLIIATPLHSKNFYEDFDHIKPYHPAGFKMAFGKKNTQMQYYGENKIELIDIWFRRRPYNLIYACGLYINKSVNLPVMINRCLVILFRISFGLFGRTDGWMGLFKKI